MPQSMRVRAYTHTHRQADRQTYKAAPVKSLQIFAPGTLCFVFSELIEPTLECEARCHCDLWGLLEICLPHCLRGPLVTATPRTSRSLKFRGRCKPGTRLLMCKMALQEVGAEHEHTDIGGTLWDFSVPPPMTMVCAQ